MSLVSDRPLRSLLIVCVCVCVCVCAFPGLHVVQCNFAHLCLFPYCLHYSHPFCVNGVNDPQQELLASPNFGSVLGVAAYSIKAKKGQAEYDRRTREQV